MAAAKTSSEFIVVIRTAGERTFPPCKRLLLQQIPEDNLFVVNEYPFEAALRRCYEIGIRSEAKWMITVDADLLLRKDAINDMIHEAESMPVQGFQVEGMVLDKLTRRFRWAGFRCYRVEHLKKAEELIPADRAEIRPEFTTCERMKKRGHQTHRSDQIFGLHDYHQSFNDIYRKAFVHANKHPDWLPELLLSWKKLATDDMDFRLALSGAFDGLLAQETPRIDTRDFTQKAEALLKKLGMTEKEALTGDALRFDEVEELISVALESSDIQILENAAIPSSRLAELYSGLGLLKIFPYLVGAVLCFIGNTIKHWVTGSRAPQ